MNITKQSFLKQIDSRFIEYLNDAYLAPKRVNKRFVADHIVPAINNNSYHLSLPDILIDYNKGFGVARPVPVFSVENYFVYYFCIRSIEKELAVNRTPNTFGGWSLSGELRKRETSEAIEDSDSPGSGGLNPAAGAVAYGEFNSKLRAMLVRAPEDATILELDIANFYDTIRIDRLQREVRAATKQKHADIVDLLFYFLSDSGRLLHSYRPQTTGIPQDMIGDCSRLLANFYLQDYDARIYSLCKKYNIEYLRFADDQVFVIPDGIDPIMICREASRFLYQIGLNINQKKVKTWSVSDFRSYRCLETYELLDVDKTNAEQLPSQCEAFANTSLCLIKKHHNSRHPHFFIKGEGLPLIKKMVGLDINRLPAATRTQFIKTLYQHDYIPYFSSYNLEKLYKSLTSAEKRRFTSYVNIKLQKHQHTAFKYELMKFRRNNNLPWKSIARNIHKNTNQWRSK